MTMMTRGDGGGWYLHARYYVTPHLATAASILIFLHKNKNQFFFLFESITFPNRYDNSCTPCKLRPGPWFQYYEAPPSLVDGLGYMNSLFTMFFSLECILKVAAFGIKVQSSSGMNISFLFSTPELKLNLFNFFLALLFRLSLLTFLFFSWPQILSCLKNRFSNLMAHDRRKEKLLIRRSIKQ